MPMVKVSNGGSLSDTTITGTLVRYWGLIGGVTFPKEMVQNWKYVKVTLNGHLYCNIGTDKIATSTITEDVFIGHNVTGSDETVQFSMALTSS